VQVVERLSTTPEETEGLGERLGRAARGGELIGLIGDLGAGKTCLVRGLARGLGIDPARVHSPSFVMVTEYGGGRLPLHHVDLYRLDPPVDDTGFLREALYAEGVVAVEWFDRLSSSPGDELVLVSLCYAGGERRSITLEARGPRHERLLECATID
jgi:tRNA threonylcarbamoyladenosine biosynthesis protein TsaE